MNPKGLLKQPARFVEISGTVPRGLSLHDQRQASVRLEATVAREWRSARAWLALEIRRDLDGTQGYNA